MDVSQHVQALFLALVSSTDNALVGLSVGWRTRRRNNDKPLSPKVLWGIALCNATGCWIATAGGSWGAQCYLSERTANGAASLAFVYLAWKEYVEHHLSSSHHHHHHDDNDKTKAHEKKVSLELALPMTLNNLAGGVAAGFIGVSAVWNFVYALVMSVVTMWVGYRLGMLLSQLLLHDERRDQLQQQHPSLVYGPIAVYLALALQSFLDCLVVGE